MTIKDAFFMPCCFDIKTHTSCTVLNDADLQHVYLVAWVISCLLSIQKY